MVSVVREKDELMSQQPVDSRCYLHDEVVAFRKTGENFGGLSNMAPGFPLAVDGVSIRTSEALYQACRFPHLPDIQRMIIEEPSPMTAKMLSKPYRQHSRPDWDDVRVPIMRWCLRVKLAQNWEKFSQLLHSTGNVPIVEDSRKDDYWGARSNNAGELQGRNVLGRLLMELRQQLSNSPDSLREIIPLPIDDFRLYGKNIPILNSDKSDDLILPNIRLRGANIEQVSPTFGWS